MPVNHLIFNVLLAEVFLNLKVPIFSFPQT